MELIKLGWIPIRFWSKNINSTLDACVNDIVDLVHSILENDCYNNNDCMII